MGAAARSKDFTPKAFVKEALTEKAHLPSGNVCEWMKTDWKAIEFQ